MIEYWDRNISNSINIVQNNEGPSLVIVVSGNEINQAYWYQHFMQIRKDIFREDGNTKIISVCEQTQKGNFLGTLNAWDECKNQLLLGNFEIPKVSIFSMVFGKGKRLSPFTQALGNRKSSFPTPMRAYNAGTYMCAADVSNLYSNLWLQHLQQSGFRGVLVKWGDEATIPSISWQSSISSLKDFDAVRFIFKTEVTENLAREKEWVVIDPQNDTMKYQFARQDANILKQRFTEFKDRNYQLAVNLGSLAISYDFLDLALKIFHEDINNPDKQADWDPYVWMALFANNIEQWHKEIEYELKAGKKGLQLLEKRYENFYGKIQELRTSFERRKGRPFRVGVIDFGKAFWVDIGLHKTLRNFLERITENSVVGKTTRDILAIFEEKDKNNNIIIRSSIPREADIKNSMIIDTFITDPKTFIRNAIIVCGKHESLTIPHGGSALFCAVNHMDFTGPHGIAFRSFGKNISIHEGGRHTSVLFPNEIINMISNESLIDYNGDNYLRPIFNNRYSFKELSELMSHKGGKQIEECWMQKWKNWSI